MTIRNKTGNNHLSSCSRALGDTRKPGEKPSKHGTGRAGGVSIPQPRVTRGEPGLRAQPGCEPRDAAGGARNGQCWPGGSAFASHPRPTRVSLLSLLKAERCRKVSAWLPVAAGSGCWLSTAQRGPTTPHSPPFTSLNIISKPRPPPSFAEGTKGLNQAAAPHPPGAVRALQALQRGLEGRALT